MDRRSLLRRTALVGAAGLAGCLAGDDPGEGTPGDTDTPTPTPTPPAIEDADIETVSTDCHGSAAGSASVQGDQETHRLTVAGTITASNPCHRAVLRATDLADGVLRVTVGTEPADVDACIECVGAIEYEATVELTTGLTAEVVVEHDYQGVSEVTRETVEL